MKVFDKGLVWFGPSTGQAWIFLFFRNKLGLRLAWYPKFFFEPAWMGIWSGPARPFLALQQAGSTLALNQHSRAEPPARPTVRAYPRFLRWCTRERESVHIVPLIPPIHHFFPIVQVHPFRKVSWFCLYALKPLESWGFWKGNHGSGSGAAGRADREGGGLRRYRRRPCHRAGGPGSWHQWPPLKCSLPSLQPRSHQTGPSPLPLRPIVTWSFFPIFLLWFEECSWSC